jgi:hypothetical protein
MLCGNYLLEQFFMSGHPQPSKRTVISVGKIPRLLSLREKVLQLAGFEVFSTTVPLQVHFKMAIGCCDVLLLCYSVSDDWQKRLIAQFRTACPHGRIIAITAGPVSENPKDVDELVYRLKGPEALMDAVAGKVA